MQPMRNKWMLRRVGDILEARIGTLSGGGDQKRELP